MVYRYSTLSCWTRRMFPMKFELGMWLEQCMLTKNSLILFFVCYPLAGMNSAP